MMPKIDITLAPSEVAAVGEKAKFTAGPWVACGDGKCKCKIVSSESADEPICTVTAGEWGDDYPSIRIVGETSLDLKAEAYMERIAYGIVPEEVAIANTNLICAAPDLLAALKAHQAHVRGDKNPFGHDCEWCGECCQRMVDMQIRAVAKAEGR